MKRVFADTSFDLAVPEPRDVAHATAVCVGGEIQRPVLLTDFILLELGGNAAFGRARICELFARLVPHLARTRTCG